MVKIMVPAYPRREAGFGTDCGGGEEQSNKSEFGSTFSYNSGTSQLPKDPSFCTFWCAVAMGALAKGSPIESVSSNRLASIALYNLGSGC